MQDPSNLRPIHQKTEIHPTAIVHPWAKIGVGVKIGPYAIIGEHVQLGDGCVVDSHVLIEGRTTIGANNRFFHSAAIGTDPQDVKYERAVSYLEIGENNIVREFCTLNVGTGQGEKTVIGSNCFLMTKAHVGHNCRLGDHIILANSVNLGGHVILGDHVVLGGGAQVHQFCQLGQHAFVGGASRITRDVPPFLMVNGNPSRAFGINSIGLERRGYSPERRAAIKRMYYMVYRSHRNVSQVLDQLRNGHFEGPDHQAIVDFLETCTRGIIK